MAFELFTVSGVGPYTLQSNYGLDASYTASILVDDLPVSISTKNYTVGQTGGVDFLLLTSAAAKTYYGDTLRVDQDLSNGGTNIAGLIDAVAALEADVDTLESDLADLAEIETNAQTGIAYTAVLSDAQTPITMDNASANVFTIPANADVAFEVGTVLDVTQLGAGTTTITAAAGVTLNDVSAGSADIQSQFGGATVLQVAVDEWVANGNIGAVS